MPLQVKRLLILFAIILVAMLILKYLLTPDSWREYGPYRGDALTEIADQEAKFVESGTCAMCHDSIAELRNIGLHKSLQCELCHGPGYKHSEDDENQRMEIPEGNDYCLKCHELNAARSQNIIKQIDAIEHTEDDDCIVCHNPHEPWL